MTLFDTITAKTQDAVLWLAMRYLNAGKNSPIAQDEAMQEVLGLLLCIPSEIKLTTYIKSISDAIAKHNDAIDKAIANITKEHKLALKSKSVDLQLVHQLEAEIESKELDKLPPITVRQLTQYVKLRRDELKSEAKGRQSTMFGMTATSAEDIDETDPYANAPKFLNIDELKQHGFTMVQLWEDEKPVRYGYYSYSAKDKTLVEITNFSINPIFHIRAGRESRHLIEVYNGYKKAVLDVESKAMVSVDLMQQYLVGEGNFIIYSAKQQYLRVASKLLQEFRECSEVKSLGWQRNGFWAFTNHVFIPGMGLRPIDEWGVVDIATSNYLIPAASPVYRMAANSEDDPYENDRPHSLVAAPITMDAWAKQMQRVYNEKGLVGVAYCFLATFRDIAFDIDNNFPHLYAFGERSSGKSKWAESLISFFFNKRPMFNLNSGTDFAFFGYMSRFRNCVAGLNEFDEKVIRPEWFQNIKGIFDGESRQRGSMVNRGKVETQKVESGLMLVGQYLVTMDDNSVVTRSIIEPFSERELSQEDKNEFERLKLWEGAGLTSLITELIQHREFIKENYRDRFNQTLSQWRALFTMAGHFNQRVMQNWAHLFTALSLVAEKVHLPSVNVQHFNQYCFERASHWCKFIRSSDTLSEFWSTLVFLSETGLIKNYWDFRIETVHNVTIRVGGEETTQHNFNEPTKVLFLRVNNIHKHYQQAYRSRTGKEGMSQENLLYYFGSRNYYLGAVKSMRFTRGDENKNSNCYAFVYDLLDIDLEVLSNFEAKKAEGDNSATPIPDERPF